MKLPSHQEVGRAVQILCAAANVDAKSERVIEVSVSARHEVTVTRIISKANGDAIVDRPADEIYTVSTTERVYFDLPQENPYMPEGI